MNVIFLYIATALAIITVLVHSIVGEQRLIKPLVQSNDGVMQNLLSKRVLRFAWHFTSILGAIAIYILGSAAWDYENADRMLLFITGSAFLIAGIYDIIATRAKHIGWPLLVAIGLFTLIGTF